MKRIPSNWTKKMFLSASWHALRSADVNVRVIAAFDLHDIALVGFTNWRNCDKTSYSIDYTKFDTDLYKD